MNINKAYAQARLIVRRKIAEQVGGLYESLSPDDQLKIDQLVEKKHKLVHDVAKKIMAKHAPKSHHDSFVKGAPIRNLGQPEGMNENINSLFLEYFPQYDTSNALGQKVDVPVAPQTNPVYRDGPGGKSAQIIQYSKFGNEKISDSNTYKAIAKKAKKAGIKEEILGEVYDRGLDAWSEDIAVSRQQYAFARVNSYINQGRTYFNEDRDLHEMGGDQHYSDTKGAFSKGTKGTPITSDKMKKDTSKTLNKMFQKAMKKEEVDLDENAWNQLGQKKPVGNTLPAPAKGSVPKHGRKFSEGDHVVPHTGPYAGQVHRVTSSRAGSVNIVRPNTPKYDSVTVRAKHEHLSPATPEQTAKYKAERAADHKRMFGEDVELDEMKTVTNRSHAKALTIKIGGKEHSYRKYGWGLHHPTYGPLKDEQFNSKAEMKAAMEKHPHYNPKLTEETELDEGRAPGTPSIKRYTRNDGTTALKSLNKWGKRKDWRDTEGGLAKAREHAGVDKVTEETEQEEDFKKVPTIEKIAKKHGVDVDEMKKRLKKGIAVEKEHTKELSVAATIALKHLSEKPDYYEKLKQYVESREDVHAVARQDDGDRKKIKNVEREPDAKNPKDPKSALTRNAEIQRKIIEAKVGNAQKDPAKRLIGTDSLTKAYVADTPCMKVNEDLNESFNIAYAAGIGVTLTAADLGMRAQGGFAYHPSVIAEMEEVEEDVTSALKQPVYVPPIRNADGTYQPARTVMRKTQKKIVKSGNVHNGEDDDNLNAGMGPV